MKVLAKIKHRIVKLNPFSWNGGPAIAIPYRLSYTDEDEDGKMERWETVYIMFRRSFYPHPKAEPRAYFWRYDGRKRLNINLPFSFFFCAGFDYRDILIKD